MKLIGRRDFVASLGLGAGAGLLTPWGRSLLAEAHADPVDGPFRRFVCWSDGVGWPAYRVVPPAPDLAGGLAPAMEPLTNWSSRMLIVDDLGNPHNIGQHGNHWATLSVVQSEEIVAGQLQSYNRWPNPGGITIDRFIGRELAEGVPFRSLHLGFSPGITADGKDEPVPALQNPSTAYAQLFGDGLPEVDKAAIDARLSRNLSVLDLVTEDLNRMRNRLAGPEREKLDQYEGAVRSLEGKLTTLAELEGSCEAPTLGGSGFPEGMSSFVDIAHAALLCGLTNVVTFSMPNGQVRWGHIGHDVGKHNAEHDNRQDALTAIDQWSSTGIAAFLDKLAGTPEGSGTMLDATVSVWVNSGGGQHHFGGEQHRAVVFARPGAYFRTGEYVHLDAGQHTMHELFLTLAQSCGIDVDTFGAAQHCNGPIEGVLL